MAEKLALGFTGRNWETVIVFPDEEMYRLVKESKPHLVPIAGLDQTEKEQLHGIVVAGIRANSRLEIQADNPAATQKQSE